MGSPPDDPRNDGSEQLLERSLAHHGEDEAQAPLRQPSPGSKAGQAPPGGRLGRPGEFPAPAGETPAGIWAEQRPARAAAARTPEERVRGVFRWLWLNPWAQGNLTARLDRWAEFFDLESRMMDYRCDLALSVIFGIPGVALWILSVFLPDLNAAWRIFHGYQTGLMRLALMLAGSYLIFLAWPRYVRKSDSVAESDAELDKMARAHEDFRQALKDRERRK